MGARCGCYSRGREALTERHVQAIWYDRDLRPDRLVTRGGEPLRVVHPGEWNLGPGPDFRNAVLELGPDARRVVGDVEIHLWPSDWDAHGHGSDPAYSRVLLHVTWGCGPDPATLPPGAMTLWLGRFMTERVGFMPEHVDLTAYPFAKLPADDRPCHEMLRNDPDLACEVLSEAGAHRLAMKARRLASILAARPHERMQVFYEEVMNALGYRLNSRSFRQVAEAVPYDRIVAEPENAAAAMVAAAEFVEWRRAGLRPCNAPEARLAAAAALFAERGLGCLAGADAFSPGDLRAMVKAMARGGLMGRGRAGAVIANVVVPFAMARGAIRSAPAWLPPEDLSEPVRLTASRMFGRDHNPAALYSGNDLRVQGLIQIHRDFCLQVHPDCGGCALPASLRHGPVKNDIITAL